jgi:hypothetical protein
LRSTDPADDSSFSQFFSQVIIVNFQGPVFRLQLCGRGIIAIARFFIKFFCFCGGGSIAAAIGSKFFLDGNDLLGELIEVGLSLIGLDLEDDEGLGNWLFLHLLDVGLLGFFKLLLGFLYYYLLVPIK